MLLHFFSLFVFRKNPQVGEKLFSLLSKSSTTNGTSTSQPPAKPIKETDVVRATESR